MVMRKPPVMQVPDEGMEMVPAMKLIPEWYGDKYARLSSRYRLRWEEIDPPEAQPDHGATAMAPTGLEAALAYRATTGRPLKLSQQDDGQWVLTPYESVKEMEAAVENARRLSNLITGVVHSDS